MAELPPSPRFAANPSLALSKQYRRLRNILELADGFELVFAVARGHALGGLLNLGKADPPEGRVQYLENIVVPGDAADLPRRLSYFKAVGREQPILYLVIRGGGEDFREAIGASFAVLNERRNRFIREHPHPVVIVGDAWLPRLMQQRAPDLWSVRSHVVFFTDLLADVPEPDPAVRAEHGGSHSEAGRSGAELEALAEAYRGSEKEADARAALSLLHRAARAYLEESEPEQALELLSLKCAPLTDRLEDRGLAVKGEAIKADALERLGHLDEVLRIRQDIELPFYAKTGDAHSEAVTWGQIADVYFRRGAYEDALRIREEKQLPVFQRLGDARSEAVTWGQIADVYYQRGAYEDALRIREEKELPVYQRLGDAYSEAVTRVQLGQLIADRDLRRATSEFQESLRLFNELGLGNEAQVVREWMRESGCVDGSTEPD